MTLLVVKWGIERCRSVLMVGSCWYAESDTLACLSLEAKANRLKLSEEGLHTRDLLRYVQYTEAKVQTHVCLCVYCGLIRNSSLFSFFFSSFFSSSFSFALSYSCPA